MLESVLAVHDRLTDVSLDACAPRLVGAEGRMVGAAGVDTFTEDDGLETLAGDALS